MMMIDPLHPTILSRTTTTTTTSSINSKNEIESETKIVNTTTSSSKPHNKKLSMTRRSLNLAHLLIKQHIKSPLKTTPAKVSKPFQNKNDYFSKDDQISKSLKSFQCRICERSVYFDLADESQACNNCGTLWDSPHSFIEPPIKTIHQDNPHSTELKVTEELLIRLQQLTLSPDQLDLFDQNPPEYLERLSKENLTEFDRCQESHRIAHTFISELFSSTFNLTNAFRIQKLYNVPSLERIDRFFHAICNIPGGREILCSCLDQFLFHPVPQMVSIVSSWKSHSPVTRASDEDEYIEWAWAVILLQCPILSPCSNIPKQKRLVITARLLGLISFMPNRLHHQIIKFYGCSQEETNINQVLRQKVELVNVFISERINYFLQVPNGFGHPSQALSPSSSEPQDSADHMNQLPKYMDDWSLLAASRVITLLFESNLGSSKIPIEAFYNASIDLIPVTDLIYDFEIWEARRSKYYTLCGYPSLLSLSSKINILTYEGKRQMGMEARQALFDSFVRRSLAPPVLVLSIRRSHLVLDSLRQITLFQGELKKLIKIDFVDEDGVDGGGLKKEWFLLLTRKLVGPEYGMFTHDEDTRQIWFNPASSEFEEFKLIGMILGLAIYNRVTLDIGLPSLVYKKLSGVEVSGLEDVASLKPDVAKGLKWLLEYEGEDLEEIFQMNFVTEYESFGTIVPVLLIQGGDKILVNQRNKKLYVKLYCDYILNKSIHVQFKWFKEGFESITNGNGFSLFQPNEIELLLIGTNYETKMKVEDLQTITKYEGFDPHHDLTIKLFWQVVDKFKFEDQKKLLMFMTGSDRIPATGLTGLQLKISKYNNTTIPSSPRSHHNSKKKLMKKNPGRERLPESHTCFNQLILDEFEEFEILELKLRLAMEESEGFSLS